MTERFSTVFAAMRGKRVGLPCRAAAQNPATGHAAQRGFVLRQTVAPSSIMAWLWSPGAAMETSLPAAAENPLAAEAPSR